MDTIRSLQSVASPALDALALAVTNLGHEFSYVALLVIAYLVLDPQRGRRLGIYVLIAFYLNGLLKGAFDTARPYLLDPSVLRSHAAELTGPGAGFPSGHAQGAATFWGIGALYVRRGWFTVLALLLIALISLSRLYLGVHLPVDVVAGLALGALLVALAPLLDRLHLSTSVPVQIAAGIALPLLLHLFLPTPDSGLILGGLAAFLTAPLILAYEPPEGWGRRVFVGVLGLLLVFTGLFGSSAILPEALKRNPFGDFARYLLLAYVGLLIAPAIARALFGRALFGAVR
ncbi:MAG TPA: phosphatase PAP2 family protein [Trueperaceae bacterium]